MVKKSSKFPSKSANSHTAQREIAALKAKNLQLLRQLDKCKAENTTLENQIIILEEKLDKEKQKPKYEDVAKQFARIKKERQVSEAKQSPDNSK